MILCIIVYLDFYFNYAVNEPVYFSTLSFCFSIQVFTSNACMYTVGI